jgi:hypothetical protein
MSSILSLVIWLACVGFGIYCIMDVQKHSDAAFEAAGTPKQTALIITIVGTACCLIGSLYYWFGIKPKVDAAEAGGGYPPPA